MSNSGGIAKSISAAMHSVTAARAVMLAAIRPLECESVTLEAALGRVLATSVIASRDQPPFDASAMDGYAGRSADMPGMLRVVGESAAGREFEGALDAGSAVRISTGAAMPHSADTVVIQEDAVRDGASVRVPASPPGRFVRPRAGDFTAGDTLLAKGRRLDGIGIALVAASGAASLLVARRPRIAILSSGDELAAPGTVPGSAQIFDSATYGVAALATSWGAVVHRLKIERDDVAAIAAAAARGLADSDLLVVIGGASVGDHDHARPALMRLGLTLQIEKIALRPGKPTWFGTVPGGLVLGLPGNPASALVCAYLFLRPMLAAMLGQDSVSTTTTQARLLEALPANGPREHYLRARLAVDAAGQQTVRAFEAQDSSLLSVFAAANALIRLAPGAPASQAGTLVEVLPLDWPC